MKRKGVIWAAAAGAFVLVLLVVTISSMPPRPPTGIAHNADDAEVACRGAVAEAMDGANFPFSANVAYQGEATYRLSGTVEGSLAGETVRRNYECLVRYTELGSYEADSVRVWQSH